MQTLKNGLILLFLILLSGCATGGKPDRYIVNYVVPDPQPEEIRLARYPACDNVINADLIACEINARAWACKTVSQFNTYVKRSSKHPQTGIFKKLENVPPHCEGVVTP